MGSNFTRREALGAISVVPALALGNLDGAGQTVRAHIPADVVTLQDFEGLARQRLDAKTFAALQSGAADEITVRWNREAFDRIALQPRVMVDVSRLDTSLTLFGQPLAYPIVLAPAGVHHLLHAEAEVETARGAALSDTVLTVPSGHSRSIGEIVPISRRAPWYQVYVTDDREATRRQIEEAERGGCAVLLVTVDGAAGSVNNTMMRLWQVATPGRLKTISGTFVWKDLAWLRSLVRMPIVLKGIIDARDAERAAKEGADGIVVSNHGGRTLDGVVATIDALPRAVDAVGGRIPVLMDGGVRRGTDVLKALARGAAAVMIGRPFLYGLAAAGAEGVHRVVTILREEFESAMALTGRRRLADIDRSVLW